MVYDIFNKKETLRRLEWVAVEDIDSILEMRSGNSAE